MGSRGPGVQSYLPKSVLALDPVQVVFLVHDRSQTDPPRKLVSSCNRWGIFNNNKNLSLQWTSTFRLTRLTQPGPTLLSAFPGVTVGRVIQRLSQGSRKGSPIYPRYSEWFNSQLFSLGEGPFATCSEWKPIAKGKITNHSLRLVSLLHKVSMQRRIAHWALRTFCLVVIVFRWGGSVCIAGLELFAPSHSPASVC